MERKEKRLIPLCNYCKKEDKCKMGPKYKRCNDLEELRQPSITTSDAIYFDGEKWVSINSDYKCISIKQIDLSNRPESDLDPIDVKIEIELLTKI